MSGGIVQLVATGAQDTWLTGQPEVSFFRSNYKRYTHYASARERQIIQGQPTPGSISMVRFEKKGDLLSYVYLTARDQNGAQVQNLDWSKVIDASVYTGSGLRMLWSHKKPSGDPYLPWKQVGGPEFDKNPDPGVLDLFSVRTAADCEDEQVADEVTSTALEGFIQRCLYGQEQAKVKRVIRHEKTGGWYVQTDSKFCARIHQEHRSNHVWFMIHKGTICQRCFDEECAKFEGDKHNLPPTVERQLKDVVPVGSPPRSSALDFLPPCWHDTLSFIH